MSLSVILGIYLIPVSETGLLVKSLQFNFKFLTDIRQIDSVSWNALAEQTDPFHQYEFLAALENSACVSVATGWRPQHLTIYQNKCLIGILPLYIKTHSYGEYVFDFPWANTYREYGLNYYPKLVCAIPFTPVTGARLLLDKSVDCEHLMGPLFEALKHKVGSSGLSSMHWLFVPQALSEKLANHQQLVRRSVQFQWFNRDYTQFADFLNALTSRKRKSIKKERHKLAEQGVKVRRLTGQDLTEQAMDFFYQCYQQTYLKRSGHKGYLSQVLFRQLFIHMREKILLVIAEIEGKPVASALYLYDQKTLYGRYWGALVDVDNLHYECCYYQGIDFCIDKGIAAFNPGTQGEHKILRGFEPIYCYSNHWLAEPAFHDGVRRFLDHEHAMIEDYKKNAEALLPYKVIQDNA
jgi:predicted N-acyltransferase